jgi:hypothetical protein
MSISFKEFSDILEKPVKSGAMKAKSKTGGQKGGKDSSIGMKSTTAKSPGGGKDTSGSLEKKLSLGFGKKSSTSKKDTDKKKKDDDTLSVSKSGDTATLGGKSYKIKPVDDKDDKKTEPEKPEKPTFGGLGLVDRKVDTTQRAAQEKKRKAGIDKYRAKVAKDKEEKAKRIETDKKTSATHAADDQSSDQQKQKDKEEKQKNIEAENKKKEQRAKEKETIPKSEETMNTETTIKEDWIEDILIDKLLSKNRVRAAKIFNAMTKRNKMKYLDTVQSVTSRNSGYTDDEVISALQDFDIDISKTARKTWEEVENQQEAEKMHNYVNTLSLERSVNLWAEAAKKDEDLDPVRGDKTLTKKSQEKITINPMEKQPSRGV